MNAALAKERLRVMNERRGVLKRAAGNERMQVTREVKRRDKAFNNNIRIMLNERNRNRSLERGLVQGLVVYHSSRPGM
jgi:hypothetical protein